VRRMYANADAMAQVASDALRGPKALVGQVQCPRQRLLGDVWETPAGLIWEGRGSANGERELRRARNRWAQDVRERVKTGFEDLDVALWIATVPQRYVEVAVVPLDAFDPGETLLTQCRCCGRTTVSIAELERRIHAAKSTLGGLRKPVRVRSAPV
jgi:hypothetical protein